MHTCSHGKLPSCVCPVREAEETRPQTGGSSTACGSSRYHIRRAVTLAALATVTVMSQPNIRDGQVVMTQQRSEG